MRTYNYSSEPPIVFMTIDTTDKSIEQLSDEIAVRVYGNINDELAKLEGTIPEECFKLVKIDMMAEGAKIVRAMVNQLKLREEINSSIVV